MSKLSNNELLSRIKKRMINWYITPNTHLLRGDIALKVEDYVLQNQKIIKDKPIISIESDVIYQYDDLGEILKGRKMENNNYVVVTKRNEYFELDWDKMDKHFRDNHLKTTQNYLKKICSENV